MTFHDLSGYSRFTLVCTQLGEIDDRYSRVSAIAPSNVTIPAVIMLPVRLYSFPVTGEV